MPPLLLLLRPLTGRVHGRPQGIGLDGLDNLFFHGLVQLAATEVHTAPLLSGAEVAAAQIYRIRPFLELR